MCGIAGILSFVEGHIPIDSLIAMSNMQNSRGIDDEGFALVNRNNDIRTFSGINSSYSIKQKYPIIPNESITSYRYGLSHQRFSIIDITDKGHQP